MLPLIIASIAVLGISIERFWAFQITKVAPLKLTAKTWASYSKQGRLSNEEIKALQSDSYLGAILAAGIANDRHGRETVRDSMEAAAAHVVHQLEKRLTILSVIAVVAPLVGLLGTVIGMIDVFTVLVSEANTNTQMLAGGIGKALITTAAGLIVAIPATIMDRYFSRRVESCTVVLEREATRFVDAMFANSSAVTAKAA